MSLHPGFRALIVSTADTAAAASLILQIDDVRTRIGIDVGSEQLSLFSAVTSLQYVGRLVATMTHSVFFSRLDPRQRAIAGFAILALSHAIAVCVWYSSDTAASSSLWWVALVFFSNGFGNGVGSPNLVTVLTHFGQKTMRWWSFGMNLGWSIVGIGYYGIVGLIANDSIVAPLALHVVMVLFCLAGIYTLATLQLPKDSALVTENLAEFLSNLRLWRSWIGGVRLDAATVGIVGAASVFVHGIVQLVYHPYRQELLPHAVVSPNVFLMIFNMINFVAGAIGAFNGTPTPAYPFAVPFLCCGCGIALVMTRAPLLALVGSGVVYFGSALYTSVCMSRVRSQVKPQHFVSANTLWFLTGNVCRVIGLAAAGPWANVVS
jgi:hypothetical protein